METQWNKTDWTAIGICSALFLLCVLAIDPRANMGLNDDWSYFYTTRVLSETGHLVYNGWATAMLGWQVYLGAAFSKLFGLSYLAVRSSVIVVSLTVVPLTYATVRHLVQRPWHATVATLAFVLSPLFLALATSYMTDVPGMFVLLLCVYGCVRAAQADTDGTTKLWLLFAATTNIAGGTVRQIIWLGALVMVPSTAWYLRRRRGVLLFAVILTLASAACILTVLHWYSMQPNVIAEKLVTLNLTPKGGTYLARTTLKVIFTLTLLMTPVLIGRIRELPFRDRALQRTALMVTGSVVVAIAAVGAWHRDLRWLTLLVGNYLSPKGILELPWMVGDHADLFSNRVQSIIVAIVVVIGALALLRPGTEQSGGHHSMIKREASAVVWIFGPFTASYLLLVITRVAIFDRYFLPVFYVLIVLAFRAFERVYNKRMSSWCLLPLTALAIYGTFATHDLFAITRARVAAADEIRALGVPRTRIRAGFEYDGETQVEVAGHINDPRVRNSRTPYTSVPTPSGVPPECVDAFYGYTPAIRAWYQLSWQADVCYPKATIPPVTYRTWLPPFKGALYILQVPH